MKLIQILIVLLFAQACGQPNPYAKPSPYDVVRFQPASNKQISKYDDPSIPYYEKDESIPICDSTTEGEVIYWAKQKSYYNCLIFRSQQNITARGALNALEEDQTSDGDWVSIPSPIDSK